MRIALFTPFNPETGGGGVIFRSILPHLRGVEIRWFYLSHSITNRLGTTHLGPPLLGGSYINDGLSSFRLFVIRNDSRIDHHVNTILAWKPDIAWVNAMNEGLLVGAKLAEAGIGHLHVSVHDDPAGLALKSKRYRLIAPLIGKCNDRLLKCATTVDVVCSAMQTYYRRRNGVSSGVVYRYVDNLEHIKAPLSDIHDQSTITIGHVGSAYSVPEVFAFLKALRRISKQESIRFRLINFGSSPAMTSAQTAFPEIVDNLGDASEPVVVEGLQKCRFLYSMYSFKPSHRVFRSTSQPTKMSTYLMAGRPVLVHCPEGSSTIDMLSRFNLGVCVTTKDISALESGIRAILSFEQQVEQVHGAIKYYCGESNIAFVKSCFGIPGCNIEHVTSAGLKGSLR